MKQGIDLNRLASQVKETAEAKRDFVLPTKNLSFGYAPMTGRIDFHAAVPNHGGIFGHFNDHSLKQMTTELRIPAVFVDLLRREDPTYLPELMNRRAYKTDSKRMLRTVHDKVVAAVSPSFSRDYDNDIILAAILPTIVEKGLTVESCNVSETMMYLKMLKPGMARMVRGSRRKDDIVEAGVMAKNSDVGLSRALIAEFMKFLVCSNGMTRTKYIDAFKRIHRGSAHPEGFAPSVDTTTAFQQALAKEMRDVMDYLLSPERFYRTIEQMEAATQRELDARNLEVAVMELGKTIGYNQSEGADIMAHLIEGGDLSQYGLMNAVTRYSQDVDDYDRASELEQLGGKVLELPVRQWDRAVELQRAA